MKTTYEIVREAMRTKGIKVVRVIVYGQGEEGFDINRDSHEAIAMQLFIDSRMQKNELTQELQA